MVETDNPFSPGEILDPIPVVGELPVQDRPDLERLRVIEQILWTEIAVHESGHTLVQPPQRPSSGAEHLPGAALVNQLLSVQAGNERHGDTGGNPVDLDDVGYRNNAGDPRQRSDFDAKSYPRVDALVLPDDELPGQP
jgi:hypothetical protein